MYTLYYMPGSASYAVHWMLIELGAPHELRLIDGDAKQQKSAEYLRLNPNGVVPTLVIDGEPVYETAALVMLLAARHPAAGLAPVPGTRAEAMYLQWMFHLANTLQPAFRNWFYPDEAAGAANAEAVKAQAAIRIAGVWDRLDAHRAEHGPFVCGAKLSAADFSAAMLASWSRNMTRPATEWPTLGRFIKTLQARPSFATLNEREGLTEWL